MGIDPLSFRQIEQQTEDIYEAIVVMSQRAPADTARPDC